MKDFTNTGYLVKLEGKEKEFLNLKLNQLDEVLQNNEYEYAIPKDEYIPFFVYTFRNSKNKEIFDLTDWILWFTPRMKKFLESIKELELFEDFVNKNTIEGIVAGHFICDYYNDYITRKNKK